MHADPIVASLLALVALTFVVWVAMYVQRLGEISRRRIDPQDLATPAKRTAALERTTCADNFRNLLELPVLFYALCLALLATRVDTAPFVAGAWLYVALRAVHSAIHCTYNRVAHRFVAYVLSSLVLFAMWAYFALTLAGGAGRAAP